MPYQLRNSTRVGETEPTPSSIASSATLEHNKDEAEKLLPNRGLEEIRPKMSRRFSEGGDGRFLLLLAGNFVVTRFRIIEYDVLDAKTKKA